MEKRKQTMEKYLCFQTFDPICFFVVVFLGFMAAVL